jgi:peptide/nickel transport system substrate-binding protein
VLSLMQGVTEICDTTVAPNTREYPEIERAIVRTPYDPRRATELITSLGYAKGSDGAFRDAAGTRLAVEIRATALSDIQPKTLAVIADNWRAIGLDVDEVVVPTQLVRDREYRNTRPGFEVLQVSNEADSFQHFHSSGIPTAQNTYLGMNRSRYASPELDALIDSYFRTVPRPERMAVLREVVRHTSEQLPFLGIFYGTSHTLIGNRISNAGGRNANATEGWNAEQWDLKEPER